MMFGKPVPSVPEAFRELRKLQRVPECLLRRGPVPDRSEVEDGEGNVHLRIIAEYSSFRAVLL